MVGAVASDGTLSLLDARTRSIAKAAEKDYELMAVRFHPVNEYLIAIGGDDGHIDLVDLRSMQHSVKSMSIGSRIRPSVTSIDINAQGTAMVLSCQSFLPTMVACYSDETVVFYDPSYRNLSTIKSFVFSPDGRHAFCGSDNRLVYRFKVPEHFEASDWGVIADPFYANSHMGHAAMIVDAPVEKITGHRSNANNVLCHPTLPYLYSCGVEKSLLCHSPFSHGHHPDKADEPPVFPQAVLLSGAGIIVFNPPADQDSILEDPYTLAMFDVLNAEAEANHLHNHS